MLGAITGDILGSVHKFCCGKTPDFPLFTPESRFTGDTILTVAVADCLMSGAGYSAPGLPQCLILPAEIL